MWWVKNSDRKNFNDAATFEAVLNYGTWDDFQSAIRVLGITNAHELFEEISQKKRSNLRPEISYYFSQYFSYHDKTSH